MNEIKKLIGYLMTVLSIIAIATSFFVALPTGDPTQIVTYLGLASAFVAVFIKFLKDLNGVIDDMEIE